MPDVLEIDSVVLSFAERHVLQSVYLKVEQGLVTGLLGLNGCGKSCLMRIIMGEMKSQNSLIRVNGNTLVGSVRPNALMRYLPQHELSTSGLKISTVMKDYGVDFEHLTSLFPEFNGLYNARIKNLSYGNHRILDMFIVLTSKCRFALLDEPFSQIMPLHINSIKKLINVEKNNKGILITDHIYHEVLSVCDNLYVINQNSTYLVRDSDDLICIGYTYN